MWVAINVKIVEPSLFFGKVIQYLNSDWYCRADLFNAKTQEQDSVVQEYPAHYTKEQVTEEFRKVVDEALDRKYSELFRIVRDSLNEPGRWEKAGYINHINPYLDVEYKLLDTKTNLVWEFTNWLCFDTRVCRLRTPRGVPEHEQEELAKRLLDKFLALTKEQEDQEQKAAYDELLVKYKEGI